MESNNKIGDARHLKDEIKDLVGKKLPIVVDFDGTVVKHHYPEIGETIPHCIKMFLILIIIFVYKNY